MVLHFFLIDFFFLFTVFITLVGKTRVYVCVC